MRHPATWSFCTRTSIALEFCVVGRAKSEVPLAKGPPDVSPAQAAEIKKKVAAGLPTVYIYLEFMKEKTKQRVPRVFQ